MLYRLREGRWLTPKHFTVFQSLSSKFFQALNRPAGWSQMRKQHTENDYRNSHEYYQVIAELRANQVAYRSKQSSQYKQYNHTHFLEVRRKPMASLEQKTSSRRISIVMAQNELKENQVSGSEHLQNQTGQ